MRAAPSFDDVLAVIAAASVDGAARVAVPEDPQLDHEPTRLAMALNALLDERSRREARLADRLRLLAEATHAFAEATQDSERLLDIVASRLVEVVKDQCVVRLVSEDGQSMTSVAIRGPDDDEATRLLRDVFSEPFSIALHGVARTVHETGEPFISPHFDIKAVRSTTTPKFYEWARRSGLHSVLLLALRHRGVSLGQLLLMRYRADSPAYDEHDVGVARALADHAAVAIANARSYATATKAEERLRASEARYRLMFDNSPLPKWMYDAETLRFLAVNEAAIREYGYSREEFLAMTLKDLRPPEDAGAMLEALQRTTALPKFSVMRHRRKSGETLQMEITSHTLILDGRACRLAVGLDVTERRRLEEQLRQSQKMEAVGRLAGGVAHDFNNVLSVILSYSDMLLGGMKSDEPMRDDVQEIRKAGDRAAALTRQLLMFSRQQVLKPRVLDLNELLANMDKMLQRILGADVALVSLPAEQLGRVRVDPSSIEQVIMNLVVNARDAMPTGGQLTMETRNVVLDETYAHEHLGVVPGPHVMLAVTDTGTGIDKVTLARIFEPFFTTKEQGKGTGLGLSTVFGIVQQSGGSVWVYSEVGKGTTFKVYLPRVDASIEVVGPTDPLPATLRGSETILLVEDDDQVRGVAVGILRRSGYQVIESRNAGEALLHAEKHDGTIHLLLTDVVMPQMSGPELAKRLVSVRPGIRVLCMSGYTDDSIVRHGVLDAHLPYLQKPITPDVLTMKVRDVLDRPRLHAPSERAGPA